jgi:hypothetical protein
MLAHLQEKFSDVNKECNSNKTDLDKNKDTLKGRKDMLSESKVDNEKNTLKKLQSKLKIDQINSTSLKKYYTQTNSNIETLEQKIKDAVDKLVLFRGDNLKDVKYYQYKLTYNLILILLFVLLKVSDLIKFVTFKLLENRKKKLMGEYNLLPKLKFNMDS